MVALGTVVSEADKRLQEKLDRYGWNVSVPWFLMASYLYYQCDISLLSDEKFDWMCKEMLFRWDNIEHYHKHLISVEDLRAGTGFSISEYPGVVQGAATQICKQLGMIEWDTKKKRWLVNKK